MRRSRAFLFFGASVFAAAAFVACGSRTGLLVDESFDAAPIDAGRDVRRDVHVADAIDEEETLPGLDARPLRDANPILCPDAGATLIYVVSDKNELLSFYPPDATFTRIGILACPDSRNPFSMAVDRKGIAYVLYATGTTDVGSLFRVSTATAACAATTFVPGQDSYASFGMGFAADDIGTGETLFVAKDDTAGGRLGSIDVKTFGLTDIAEFSPPVYSGELTGTGDGRLFTFYSKSPIHGSGLGSAVAQIDKRTGKIVAEALLPTVDQGSAWAFGFWGGDFYLFVAPANVTEVWRYRPTDGSVVNVTTFQGGRITGAGVSTCAPAQ